MKIISIIMVLLIFLTSCSNNNEQQKYNELIRTGEYYTAEQMEELKTQAFDWNSIKAGMGSFADIIIIETADGNNQQVYISFDYQSTYERVQIKANDGVRAVIIAAYSGAGSGEVEFKYKFTSDSSEWVEIFFAYAGNMIADKDAKIINITDSYKTEEIEN